MPDSGFAQAQAKTIPFSLMRAKVFRVIVDFCSEF